MKHLAAYMLLVLGGKAAPSKSTSDFDSGHAQIPLLALLCVAIVKVAKQSVNHVFS